MDKNAGSVSVRKQDVAKNPEILHHVILKQQLNNSNSHHTEKS